MNLSGTSIREVVEFYNIKMEDILIIYDDMDLPFAQIKLREKGGSGGHNGVQNIIENLKTKDIKRIRFGIGKSSDDSICHVLGKFSQEERNLIDEKLKLTNQILHDFLITDFDKLMSKYN